jgi:hypothetical protein
MSDQPRFLELDDDTTHRLAQGTMKLSRATCLTASASRSIHQSGVCDHLFGDYRRRQPESNRASAGTTRVVVQQGSGTIYGDGGASVMASGQQANPPIRSHTSVTAP